MAGPGLEPGDAGEHDATDLVPTLVRLLGHVPAEGLAGVPIRSVISHA